MTFEERIEGLCRERRWQMTYASVKLGKNERYLRVLANHSYKDRPVLRMRSDTIEPIAELFGLTVDELLEDVESVEVVS